MFALGIRRVYNVSKRLSFEEEYTEAQRLIAEMTLKAVLREPRKYIAIVYAFARVTREAGDTPLRVFDRAMSLINPIRESVRDLNSVEQLTVEFK